jgi:hypothetical protein
MLVCGMQPRVRCTLVPGLQANPLLFQLYFRLPLLCTLRHGHLQHRWSLVASKPETACLLLLWLSPWVVFLGGPLPWHSPFHLYLSSSLSTEETVLPQKTIRTGSSLGGLGYSKPDSWLLSYLLVNTVYVHATLTFDFPDTHRWN